VGLGKTTISRRIINVIENKGVETSLVFYTGFKDVELIRGINRDFGLTADSLLFSDQMQLLYDFLVEKNRCGKNCAIIIDDAQNLDSKSLELIRMISNLETGGEKLVQILLVGQPELIHLLDSKELRQLRSRIVIQQEVKALTREELKDYLYFKLNLAGNSGHIRIQKTALNKIHKLTRGNFRQVNLLMDRCLYVAFLHNTSEINRKIVTGAFVDLHPKKLNLMKKPLSLMASIFMMLSLFGGMVYSGFSRDISSTPSNIKTYVTPKDNGDSLKLDTAKSALQITDSNIDKEPNRLGQHSVIPESVIDFLDEYKLSNYRGSFFEALETGRFQALTEVIFEKTGYMLVRLNHVSDHIQSAYGTLKYISNLTGHQNFYLFWRPPLVFTKFYYYYQGEEILKLQQMMARINLYSGLLDGIVGKKLMLAVVNYQKQAGLSVTGYPDGKTIFLLCHEMEKI
jgi:general secretion pathway protein A